MFSPEGEQTMEAYAEWKAPTPEATPPPALERKTIPLPTPETTAPAQPEPPETEEKHEPTIEKIHKTVEDFGTFGKVIGEDTDFQLAVRLGMPPEKFAAIQEKDSQDYGRGNVDALLEIDPADQEKLDAQAKKYEQKKLKLRTIDHLREFALKGHPGMEKPLAKSYKFLSGRIEEKAQDLKLAIKAAAGPELTQKIAAELRLLSKSRKNLKDNAIKGRYPELWREINGGDEEEENNEGGEEGKGEEGKEKEIVKEIPVGPEFLSPEAWKVAAGAGLNYVATEIRPAYGNRPAEQSYLIYLDPDSANLAPNLEEQITGADEKILTMEQGLKNDNRQQQRDKLNLLREQTSWTAQAKTLRARFDGALKTNLNKAKKNGEIQGDADQKIITKLAGASQMEYPNQAEATAILLRLKKTRPNEALAIYAQNERGEPIMVAISKTDKDIFVKSVDPDRRTPIKDTTLITPIGRRITPREAEDIKKMEITLKPGLAMAA